MKKSEARFTHLSVLLAAVSGFVYGGLLYFGEVEDEFGPVAHPWVPTMHTAHVLVVPLFLMALGLIWQHHIVHKLRTGAKARRTTGILLLSQAFPMIASGYLIQVTVEEFWRAVWIWTHGITSSLFAILFVLHLMVRVRRG